MLNEWKAIGCQNVWSLLGVTNMAQDADGNMAMGTSILKNM